MIIAIPMEEKSLESGVCVSFGRAPYFLFYDTDTNKGDFIHNSAADSQGGAGIKAAQIISDHGAKALLTPRCGENAQAVLNESEIQIYKSLSASAQQNIDAFAAGKLALLSEFHPGFHGHAR